MIVRISSAVALRSSVSLAVALKISQIRSIQLLGEFLCLAHALAHGGFGGCEVGSCQDVDNCGRFYVIEAVKHCQRGCCRLHAIGIGSINSELSDPPTLGASAQTK